MAFSGTEETIKDFLLTEVFYEKELKHLDVMEPLIGSGMLDSLGIMRVVAFCEETFGIELPDTEILPENFETVRTITDLVNRYRSN